MLSAQEKRDNLFVAILQRMHNDEESGEFSYGFDDVPSGEGYYGVHYFIQTCCDNPSLHGFGKMVTDAEMTHVLIETYLPLHCQSIFLPGRSDA